jgi:hypothetical protein
MGELAAHPFMAFVAVIARMPEQPQRKGDRVERLVNADQPELLLEDPRERGGQRQQRIAVQREEQADLDKLSATAGYMVPFVNYEDVTIELEYAVNVLGFGLLVVGVILATSREPLSIAGASG